MLEAWRVRYLSRKDGALSTVMDMIGKLSREERPAYGQAANELKARLKAPSPTGRRRSRQSLQAELAEGALDVTLPGRPPQHRPPPHHHANTAPDLPHLRRDGLRGLRGAGSRDRRINFGLLNIPPYHPARDMWDTFWVSQDPNLATDERWSCAPIPAPVRSG